MNKSVFISTPDQPTPFYDAFNKNDNYSGQHEKCEKEFDEIIKESFKKYDDEVENYEAKATVEDYFIAGWKAALENKEEYEEKLLRENIHLHNKTAMYMNECLRISKEKHPEMSLEDQAKFRKHLNWLMDFTADHENCRNCFHYVPMVTNIINDSKNGECTLYPCEQCDWNSEFLEKEKKNEM